MIECGDIDARRDVESPKTMRQHSGARNYAAGIMAEESVLRHYNNMGCQLLASRWRGAAGEIDLIFREGEAVVFVEVKQGRDQDAAAARISRRQMDRICMAAVEYVGTLPTGQLAEMRFDAALVDAMGRVSIIRDAFGDN